MLMSKLPANWTLDRRFALSYPPVAWKVETTPGPPGESVPPTKTTSPAAKVPPATRSQASTETAAPRGAVFPWNVQPERSSESKPPTAMAPPTESQEFSMKEQSSKTVAQKEPAMAPPYSTAALPSKRVPMKFATVPVREWRSTAAPRGAVLSRKVQSVTVMLSPSTPPPLDSKRHSVMVRLVLIPVLMHVPEWSVKEQRRKIGWPSSFTKTPPPLRSKVQSLNIGVSS